MFIGCVSTLISTVIAILFGGLSGIAPQWADTLLMRFTEVFLSIPNLLLVILLQAILGKPNVLSVSLVIGVTSWASIAKVVRTEVRQIRGSDYVTASRCMGGGFFHVLGRHLTPNFLPAIQFMVVMNVRSAIVAESTLSFMGMGLPLETVSWGSMLSLSEKALLSGSWWLSLIHIYICARIAVMYDGKIVESGVTDQIIHHSSSDYTKKLLQSVFLADQETMTRYERKKREKQKVF